LRARRASRRAFGELTATRRRTFRRRHPALRGAIGQPTLIDQQDSLADAFNLTGGQLRIERAQPVRCHLGRLLACADHCRIVVADPTSCAGPIVGCSATQAVAAAIWTCILGWAARRDRGLVADFDAMTHAARVVCALELSNRDLTALNKELGFCYSGRMICARPCSIDGFAGAAGGLRDKPTRWPRRAATHPRRQPTHGSLIDDFAASRGAASADRRVDLPPWRARLRRD
jgi:hypothetical protein